MAHQNLWDTVKTVLRGEFIMINACIKKKEELSVKEPEQYPKTKKEKSINKHERQNKNNLWVFGHSNYR